LTINRKCGDDLPQARIQSWFPCSHYNPASQVRSDFLGTVSFPTGLRTYTGECVRANRFVIATGSRPIVPLAWEPFRDRIITSDEFFDLEDLPQSVAVIGLGVIGLEIGQSLSRLGLQVTGIDQLQTISGLSDLEVAKTAIDVIGKEMPLWLGHTADVTAASNGMLRVQAGEQSVEVERVFASMGRLPNLDNLGLTDIGVELDARGIPVFDPATMRIGDTQMFIAGDVTGERPLLHEAGDEGRIAGYNAISAEPVKYCRCRSTIRSWKRRYRQHSMICMPGSM